MTLRIENKKWILYRHINDFKLLCSVAEFLKSFSKTTITKEEKAKLNLKLKEVGLYKERNSEFPLDAINHKINQLSYYMFGYQAKVDGEDRFLFSPLGNLFLKHIDNDLNSAKIFMTMLWAVQFQHPHSGTNSEFQLYPFRLIFRLLLDERLSNKLYAYEVAYTIVFVNKVSPKIYENLVIELMQNRKLSDKELETKFKSDSHVYVNSAYEWDYYVSTLFNGAGVLDKKNGEVICKLQHGNGKTFRKVTRNEVSISKNVLDLVRKLEIENTFLEKPLILNDPERLKIDVTKEIYSFYPRFLLEDIGELINDKKLELLNLPKLIEQYSNNNNGSEAYLFEDALVDGFNMFYNIEAEKIGGAGNTDVECLYLTQKKKFAVDAKSTKNKLSGINSGRLDGHREKIGGTYTIVITPRYVPAVLQDIKTSPIVIIRASTFSEYLYNCIENDIREIDYQDFDNIIVNNLGKDISKNISDLTIARFATKN
ncbi:restriction endonuclease [Flavobacterium psychrophilum]|uniref:restriction endonuclease n=1 Tax=Flavobacterium psychrophilum TaxID=96345 RepID=UPI000B7C285A|nr:restriction endonuclease [Flavobacterium psychrophilum]EKT4500412.1 restriction endonuclease [Flavobacterium psychrophilum]EKT4549517.1 restriction endonuclease [Flavobacterium psychrophilum]MBF2025045.1 restriction endonuclease [Flavobacterium psychrophilum]MCB5984544.1 restriction endonuclease [Flavobacterium psychrophilum]MCB5993709.1 restriction endonuclease [Flavobacterium psychrophilum]